MKTEKKPIDLMSMNILLFKKGSVEERIFLSEKLHLSEYVHTLMNAKPLNSHLEDTRSLSTMNCVICIFCRAKCGPNVYVTTSLPLGIVSV